MMKRKNNARLFLFLCFGCMLLCGCVEPDIKNVAARGANIICFGDSITMGYGVEPGQDYPFLLGKMLSVPVVNAGIDGETSTEALKRIQSDVLDNDPLLVIIEFGGNDFLKKVPLNETVANIEAMITVLHERGVMVALADVSTSIVMADYGKEFRRLSKKYGTILIPQLLKGILTNPSLKSDFIHPNAEGYKIVTHRVYRAISPYLNRNAVLQRLKKST